MGGSTSCESKTLAECPNGRVKRDDEDCWSCVKADFSNTNFDPSDNYYIWQNRDANNTFTGNWPDTATFVDPGDGRDIDCFGEDSCNIEGDPILNCYGVAYPPFYVCPTYSYDHVQLPYASGCGTDFGGATQNYDTCVTGTNHPSTVQLNTDDIYNDALEGKCTHDSCDAVINTEVSGDLWSGTIDDKSYQNLSLNWCHQMIGSRCQGIMLPGIVELRDWMDEHFSELLEDQIQHITRFIAKLPNRLNAPGSTAHDSACANALDQGWSDPIQCQSFTFFNIIDGILSGLGVTTGDTNANLEWQRAVQDVLLQVIEKEGKKVGSWVPTQPDRWLLNEGEIYQKSMRKCEEGTDSYRADNCVAITLPNSTVESGYSVKSYPKYAPFDGAPDGTWLRVYGGSGESNEAVTGTHYDPADAAICDAGVFDRVERISNSTVAQIHTQFKSSVDALPVVPRSIKEKINEDVDRVFQAFNTLFATDVRIGRCGCGTQSIGVTPINVAGTLVQVAVNNQGVMWGVDHENLVWRRTNTSPTNPEGSSWDKVTTWQMRKVSVGTVAGKPLVLCTDHDNKIWWRKDVTSNTSGGAWVRVNASFYAKDVAAGPNGQVWAIRSDRRIFYRNGVSSSTPSGSSFTQVSGSLDAISVGEVGNQPMVWGINSSQGSVWWRRGLENSNMGVGWSGKFFSPTSSKFVSVSAGPSGQVVAVTETNEVFERTCVTTSNPGGTDWNKLPFSLKQVAANVPGMSWGVTSSNRVRLIE